MTLKLLVLLLIDYYVRYLISYLVQAIVTGPTIGDDVCAGLHILLDESMKSWHVTTRTRAEKYLLFKNG